MFGFLELQYALTLSEQTKTNLESELRVFESNIENLNQQLTRAEEKLVNVSSQKEKLVSINKYSMYICEQNIMKYYPLNLGIGYSKLDK